TGSHTRVTVSDSPMKRQPRVFLLSAIVLGIVAAPFRSSSTTARAASSSEEVRGLWVLSSTLTSPASIETMVRSASTAGFNTLLVQVRSLGEAYYRSAIEPRASRLDAQPSSFDPLATTLQLAHAAKLRVHAWINVNFVASAATLPHSRDHVITRHP